MQAHCTPTTPRERTEQTAIVIKERLQARFDALGKQESEAMQISDDARRARQLRALEVERDLLNDELAAADRQLEHATPKTNWEVR